MSTAPLVQRRPIPLVQALNHADRLWHLQRTGLTEGLSLDEQHEVAAVCSDLLFEKGRVVYRQEDPADALYLVNRGSVVLSAANAEGREKVVSVLGPAQLFGEEALGIGGSCRTTRAVVYEECWVFVVSRESLQALMLSIPALALNVVRVVIGRLTEAREELETFSFLTTEQRIARALIKLGEDHGRRSVSDSAIRKLRIPVSHELLSHMVGANRPHVSAIMSQFKKNGWIRYHQRRLLIDVDRLAEQLGMNGAHS